MPSPLTQTGIEVRQKNIEIIDACIVEIQESLNSIEKVSHAFLEKTLQKTPWFQRYIPNFLKIVTVIRKVIHNSLILGRHVVLHFNQEGAEWESSMAHLQEALDRIFELNLLNEKLAGFDEELKHYLNQEQQFLEKAGTRKDYVDTIKQRGEIALIRELYTLNVRRGLYGIRNGFLDGKIALKQGSHYNAQRVANQTIQYFRKITEQLKIETHPILSQVRNILAKTQDPNTRDNSHRFVLSIMAHYNKSLTQLVKDQLTEPILNNFIISPDNIETVGLDMDGLLRDSNLANELFALGRLVPREKIDRRNHLKAQLDAPEIQEKVRKLCNNLFDPMDYDTIYDIIADVKPHTREIPSMLHAIGKVASDLKEAVSVPMQTRHLTLHKLLQQNKTHHKLNETLFGNTHVKKLQAFLIIFSHFYYRVAASDGDNF